ncbi:MAG: FAD-dependent oxidoreductase, partial [Legionella sp.]|nr:FAD-dependent oxidoreductase [Legionella sp.]
RLESISSPPAAEYVEAKYQQWAMSDCEFDAIHPHAHSSSEMLQPASFLSPERSQDLTHRRRHWFSLSPPARCAPPISSLLYAAPRRLSSLLLLSINSRVSLGSKVSVVEMTNGLLPGADRDLVSVLKRRLDTKFAGFRLETKVAGLKEKKNGIEVTFETAKGEQSVETFDKVLISIGQRPNTADLGLETTAIKLDERRFVVVDGQRRTSEPNIFAIGDIAGEPTMAHKSPP